MGDPYRRFGAPADRGSVPIPSFPGYLSSEPSSLTSHHPWNNFSDLQGNASDYLRKDVLPLQPGPYGVDVTGVGVRPEYSLGGLTAGASINAHPAPLQDPSLLSQRRDIALGVSAGIPDLINDRPNSLRKVDGLPVPAGESNILFVEGLPNDCLRREVGHLFRPFIGFKDIRVVHREPRRSGDKSMVLCFVEFDDAKCALTAMEALQGYKFDDKKPDSPVLRIHFAHFPFRLPSDHNEQQFGGPR
ncbi:RNA-binding protein 2-like [Cornus florida]|uniref:RNA-binding protein 2-like n=1 Tax=Cornus florida TaxID=4283 RepID=UPI002898FD5B|nr:RNA-binding protein 2-like [Cornus florida]